MESEGLIRDGFGGSLPVENVQALASKNLKDIPSRYIRPEVEFDVIALDESLEIPVIDMSKLGHADELEKLHLACKDWGFFQLINHGVGDEVIEKMKIDIQEFFELPLEEKMACAQLPNNIEGYGQAFVVSEDQKLDWGDMLFLLPQPVPIRNMRFWPTIPSSFRETFEKYSMELRKVATHLMRLMAKSLGTDLETLASFFEDGTQGIRMNYYPPCAQANKIMSNGEYKSIEHRAVVNPVKERLSIAAFHSPNRSTKIGPLPDLVKAKEAKYRTMSHEKFVKLTVSSKLNGKGLLEQMKL
ncbi:Oxoglutarate/iron-dependent dioxygenase - like 10 [Theobroma cacao]|nr:Oxoglutarate/iron-dependent dioxygenase - like 10 [Theobroma cacao]